MAETEDEKQLKLDYAEGFSDGLDGLEMKPNHTEHPDFYEIGYLDGVEERTRKQRDS